MRVAFTLGAEIPPRMRGRVNLTNLPADSSGNTPAYAGKSDETYNHRWARRKYPRVCGEEASAGYRRYWRWEIPPRMRGRVNPAPTGGALPGNTPAYAGKRRRLLLLFGLPWKYPRVCGEEHRLGCPRYCLVEIPPRMRGRDLRWLNRLDPRGNTPAYAGKSPVAPSLHQYGWKYPRVCGEECSSCISARIVREIPPRMRGRDYLISNFISCLPVFRDFWGHPCRSKLCHLVL